MFINQTDKIAVIMTSMTQNVTGSIALTFLYIMLILIAISLASGIPIEVTAIIILPLGIVLCSQYSEAFIPLLGLMLIYLSVILAKNFFFK